MPAAKHNHSISDEHPAWRIWTRIELLILHLCVLGISGVLLGAFWVQFVGGEYPCPLCLLQRMAMILTAVGSIFVITHGHYARIQGFSVMGLGYGMSLLAAVVGMSVSTRQILLHIVPGDSGYGNPVFGLHLYTWALIVFVFVIMVSGLMLIFGREPVLHCPVCHDTEPAASKTPHGLKLPWYSWCMYWLFGAVILANAVSAFAEAGFNAYLPDNPTSYILFEGDGTSASGTNESSPK